MWPKCVWHPKMQYLRKILQWARPLMHALFWTIFWLYSPVALTLIVANVFTWHSCSWWHATIPSLITDAEQSRRYVLDNAHTNGQYLLTIIMKFSKTVAQNTFPKFIEILISLLWKLAFLHRSQFLMISDSTASPPPTPFCCWGFCFVFGAWGWWVGCNVVVLEGRVLSKIYPSGLTSCSLPCTVDAGWALRAW